AAVCACASTSPGLARAKNHSRAARALSWARHSWLAVRNSVNGGKGHVAPPPTALHRSALGRFRRPGADNFCQRLRSRARNFRSAAARQAPARGLRWGISLLPVRVPRMNHKDHAPPTFGHSKLQNEPSEPGDEVVGEWPRDQLVRMDEKFCRTV